MSFRRDWARFVARGHTLGPTPGVREAWHRGRPWYHVWVLRIDDPLVVARRDVVASSVARWIRPVVSPHVTVWVSGWEPEADHPDAGRTVVLEVGAANSFASAVFLEVRCAELPGLRATFRRPEERWGSYHPHLTVGLYSGRHAVAPVVAALRAERRARPMQTEGVLVRAWVNTRDETAALRYEEPRADSHVGV